MTLERPPLTPGSDRFKPVAIYKHGPFGMVTLLYDVARARKVVGRCLAQPAGASEVELLEGIARQATLLKSLSHPGLPVFDRVVEGDGGTWMLFEHQAGMVLSQYIDHESDIPEDWLLWWLYQLLQALDALHTHDPPMSIGYIEPSDVVVRGDGVVIVDHGLFEDIFPEAGVIALSQHPFINFIAPEKRSSRQDMPLADLFSAGAMAFWMITGRAPAVRGTQSAELHRGFMQASRPTLGAEVIDLVADLLSYYPTSRPRSALDALARLTAHVGDMRGLQPPAGEERELMFLADQTRPILGPDDLREAPRPRPPRPAFADLEPERLTPARELAENVAWGARQRPWRAALLTVLALGLVAGAVSVLLKPTPPGPPPPVLIVQSGHLVGKTGLRWQPLREVTVGTVMATPANASAVLRFGHSTVDVRPGSVLHCVGQHDQQLELALDHGEVTIATAAPDSVHLALPQGIAWLTSDTAMSVSLGDHAVFTCTRGHATVAVGSGERIVLPGQPLTL